MASQSSADFTSVYFYSPSLAAAVIFTILYFIPATVLLWQTCIRYKDWRLLCLPIGALIEVGGYICRSYSVQHTIDIVSSAPFVYISQLTASAGIRGLSLLDCHRPAVHCSSKLRNDRAFDSSRPAARLADHLGTSLPKNNKDLCDLRHSILPGPGIWFGNCVFQQLAGHR
jgi:hypothetical protein